MVRSYSRTAGCSAAPETTGIAGKRSLIRARACSSCIGLRNDQRNDNASVVGLLHLDQVLGCPYDLFALERGDDSPVAVDPLARRR